MGYAKFTVLKTLFKPRSAGSGLLALTGGDRSVGSAVDLGGGAGDGAGGGNGTAEASHVREAEIPADVPICCIFTHEDGTEECRAVACETKIGRGLFLARQPSVRGQELMPYLGEHILGQAAYAALHDHNGRRHSYQLRAESKRHPAYYINGYGGRGRSGAHYVNASPGQYNVIMRTPSLDAVPNHKQT